MAQGLITNTTRIVDPTGNIAPTSNNGLMVDSPSIKNLLSERLSLLRDIEDYLEMLSQTGVRGAAASLPISVANDQIVATSIPDVTVSGQINSTGTLHPTTFIPGTFVDIELSGHSVVAGQAMGLPTVSSYLLPYASLDGINFVPTPAINSAGGLAASKYGFYVANYPWLFLVPCSGYKRVRILNTSGGMPGGVQVTLRASAAMPMNYLSLLLSSAANTSLTGVQYAYSYVGSAASTLVPRFYQGLQRAVIYAAADQLFSLYINNFNDFSIYLLFYNTTTIANILSATPNMVISVPPGLTTINSGNFNMYNLSSGLCLAASQSPYSYVPLQLGPDVTTFTGI